MDNSEQIWRQVDAKKDPFEALSDRTWGMPEPQYAEHRSVAEHLKEMEREGFRLKSGRASARVASAQAAAETALVSPPR